MHYSAKRGIAIACRLSVRLSVTLVDQDHTGWKSWKLTARTISATPSLVVTKGHPPNARGTWGHFGETRGGVGKSGVLEHKSGNISETRKDRGKVAMEELTNAFSNGTIPTPYSVLFPKIGVCNPHPKLQSVLSQLWIKLRTSNFVRTFIGSIGRKAL